MPRDPEYYTSERFIHDELVKRAGAGILGLFEAWKCDGYIDPFVLGWPTEPVLDDKDAPVSEACILQLEEGRDSWSRDLSKFSQMIKAYALLFVEQTEDSVLAILESPHGTKSWTIPIHRSGDQEVLGSPKIEVDVRSIGLLWSAKRGTA